MAMDKQRVNSRNAAGQGLAEFAIVLPVLLIIIIGLFDVGRAFFTLIVVTNASREGARYLSIYPQDKGNLDASNNPYAGTKEMAAKESIGSFITISPGNVAVTYCLDSNSDNVCDNATPVRVRVTKLYQPLFANIFPATLTIARETEMMVP